MKKLVIFDCDGVCVDSEIIANRIYAQSLSALGCNITTEDMIRLFTGLSLKATQQLILDRYGLDLGEEFFAIQSKATIDAFNTELTPLMHTILPFLDERNIARCVASNSNKTHVLHCLESTDLFRFFTLPSIFTASQVKKGKPAPDLFLLAAAAMGYAPENCLVIEDSRAGIQAALAAGMHVIGFLGGTHAGYDWYRDAISKEGVPVVNDCVELQHYICDVLQLEGVRIV